MSKLFSTKEVAAFLKVNEKMIYSLISEKGLPATKVTGKWLFPMDLIEQWVEAGTVNYPESYITLPPYHGLILIAGSNDILLDKLISFFNSNFEDHMAMFGFTGSMGGLRALRKNSCHIAASHLVADNEEYNFPFIPKEMKPPPAVVNFCMREQGIIVQKGNPDNIKSVSDFAKKGIKIVNRGLGTGTRQLFDKELQKADIESDNIEGYNDIVSKHMDLGLEILAGRADAGPGIRPVAKTLDLDFIPVCWERFDFLIQKERFFDKGIQLFLGLMKEEYFKTTAENLDGYNISKSGDMVYPIADD
ncbi:MAG: helix-turn-helix transcriptional regulator [Desulfobacteraceae bacterium]|nr:helix-turn-helix transcriptional regulator [Desulfobacteraceae bacterium]